MLLVALPVLLVALPEPQDVLREPDAIRRLGAIARMPRVGD